MAGQSSASNSGPRNSKLSKLIGYSNSQNPFGDDNLLEPFVWHKKREQEQKDKCKDPYDKPEWDKDIDYHRQNLVDNQSEIRRVRQSRLDREFVKQVSEEENARQQSEKDAQYCEQWQTRAVQLENEQLWLRSKIRLECGSGENEAERVTDLLAYCIRNEFIEGLEEPEMNPLELVESLQSENSVKRVMKAVKKFRNIGHGSNSDYWDNISSVLTSKLSNNPTNSNLPTQKKIEAILKDKSIDQLKILAGNIVKKIESEDPSLNIEFWEDLQSEITLKIAKLYLETLHQKLRSSRKEILKDITCKEKSEVATIKSEIIKGLECNTDKDSNPLQKRVADSPALKEFEKVAKVKLGIYLSNFILEFNDDIEIKGINYGIKPQFFNVAINILDKNRYNQNKFEDESIPMPKVVDGYKFNIFFKGLKSNKGLHPSFKVIEDSENPKKHVFITFSVEGSKAYRPVRFRIARQAWQTDWKRGYRNEFRDEVLYLHFRFQHIRYR